MEIIHKRSKILSFTQEKKELITDVPSQSILTIDGPVISHTGIIPLSKLALSGTVLVDAAFTICI